MNARIPNYYFDNSNQTEKGHGCSHGPSPINFLENHCKTITTNDIKRNSHPTIIEFGNPNVTIYIAEENLPDRREIKGRLTLPLYNQNKIKGLLFLSHTKDEPDIHIGEGNLFLNIEKDRSLTFLTDDLCTFFAMSYSNHPAMFIQNFDPDVIEALEQDKQHFCAICLIHEVNDVKRKLRNITHVIVIGICEPVTQYSDPYEVNQEVKTLLKTAKLNQWRSPQVIASELLPVSQLTREMLPVELANYVFDEAERADNMSPDMIAVCLITSLASLIGARVGIKPKALDNWTIIPNLWGGIVSPPSSKKSPAFDAGTYPLDRLVTKAKAKYEDALKRYEVSSLVKDANKSALTAKLRDASKKGDEDKQQQIANELYKLADEDEASPILKRYSTNDPSPEALTEIEKLNPNGVLVLRDELTGWLVTIDKDPSARAFFLEAFNGNKPYQFDRILRGSGYIENHCVSILGGIQPDKLISYLEPSIKGMGNDGLFQRFQMIVYPDPTLWQYKDRLPNIEARNDVFNLFKDIDELCPSSLVKMGAYPKDDVNPRPYFRFSASAQKIFVEWTTKLHTEKIKNEEHPILVQHLQKYPKLMASLALIFHLIDGFKFGTVGDISSQSIEMALEWCEYLESHARRIYGLVLNAVTAQASLLGTRLQKLDEQHDWRSNGFKARDIHRKNWKSLTDIQSIESALELLVDKDWLSIEEITTTDKGGRPTQIYTINPKIYEMN